MPPVFLIVGAPAVGKSTTARALAAKFPKSMHIPVDDVREMVKNGLVLPGVWDKALIEQLRLARQSVTQMACIYNSAGFAVAIDDFWDPNSQLREYGPLFQELDVHKILLYPSQRAAEERNIQRNGPGDASSYIASGIQLVYGNLNGQVANLQQQGWLVVDTTDKTVDTVVGEILARVENF